MTVATTTPHEPVVEASHRCSASEELAELKERIWSALERTEAMLMAIYDDGYPATDMDRWLLFGIREALTGLL